MRDAPRLVEPLERACLAAWPPAHHETRHGWEFCATEGRSGRVNAVWPLDWRGDTPLADAIVDAIAWCDAHGIAPAFKLADSATAPSELPYALSKAGFAPDTETLVMTAPISERTPRPSDVELHAAADAQVWAPLRQSAPDPADYQERVGIVRRIAEPHVFALARRDGAPACSGLGVLSDAYLGIYLMRTAPSARRRGAARDVLNALLHWGATHEARWAYLQVEAANEPACALYSKAGFTVSYCYRYWRRR